MHDARKTSNLFSLKIIFLLNFCLVIRTLFLIGSLRLIQTRKINEFILGTNFNEGHVLIIKYFYVRLQSIIYHQAQLRMLLYGNHSQKRLKHRQIRIPIPTLLINKTRLISLMHCTFRSLLVTHPKLFKPTINLHIPMFNLAAIIVIIDIIIRVTIKHLIRIQLLLNPLLLIILDQLLLMIWMDVSHQFLYFLVVDFFVRFG